MSNPSAAGPAPGPPAATLPPPPPLPPILRGSPQRISDLKEAYQEGLIRSIAAASGIVVARPEIDEGIDLILTHRLPGTHTIDDVARMEVQLKATAAANSRTQTGLVVKLKRDRYDLLRKVDPSVPRILIAMSVPPSQDDWVHASDKRARVRHAAYWVNLEGAPTSSAAKVSVTAPFTQRLDDRALCDIMIRIGRGGKP